MDKPVSPASSMTKSDIPTIQVTEHVESPLPLMKEPVEGKTPFSASDHYFEEDDTSTQTTKCLPVAAPESDPEIEIPVDYMLPIVCDSDASPSRFGSSVYGILCGVLIHILIDKWMPHYYDLLASDATEKIGSLMSLFIIHTTLLAFEFSPLIMLILLFNILIQLIWRFLVPTRHQPPAPTASWWDSLKEKVCKSEGQKVTYNQCETVEECHNVSVQALKEVIVRERARFAEAMKEKHLHEVQLVRDNERLRADGVARELCINAERSSRCDEIVRSADRHAQAASEERAHAKRLREEALTY